LGLTTAVRADDRTWLRRLRPVLEALFVAVPLVLVTQSLGQEWAVTFAAHVSASALALAIAVRAAGREASERPSSVGALLAGMAVAAGVTVLFTLAHGTSLRGLADGMLLRPLRQAGAFTYPLHLPARSWVVAPATLLCGVVCHRQARARGAVWVAAMASLRLAAGGFLLKMLAGGAFQIGLVLGPALACLVALPPISGRAIGGQAGRDAR